MDLEKTGRILAFIVLGLLFGYQLFITPPVEKPALTNRSFVFIVLGMLSYTWTLISAMRKDHKAFLATQSWKSYTSTVVGILMVFVTLAIFNQRQHILKKPTLLSGYENRIGMNTFYDFKTDYTYIRWDTYRRSNMRYGTYSLHNNIITLEKKRIGFRDITARFIIENDTALSAPNKKISYLCRIDSAGNKVPTGNRFPITVDNRGKR